jgi:hypothetical protein
VVNSQMAASLTQFIALVRKRPGEISYGSAGVGTAHHLYGQVLNKRAGIEMLYVPYKGVTPALNDLLGGHVPAAIVSLAAALAHIQSGRLRLLTVFDTKRYAKLPDVPIVSEEVAASSPGGPDRPVGAARPAGCDHHAPARGDRAHQFGRRAADPQRQRARDDRQHAVGIRRHDPYRRQPGTRRR